MNFKKLQAMQEELDNDILAEKAEMTAEERFNKTLVALSVEVAEIANCSEHFKFWKDHKGNVDEKRFRRIEYTNGKVFYADWGKNAKEIHISFEQAHKLTLVEECSDAIHFILSLANQIGYEINDEVINIFKYPRHQLDTLYVATQNKIMDLLKRFDEIGSFKALLSFFVSYVNELGITTDELEQAYYEKNEVNYQRLREGY